MKILIVTTISNTVAAFLLPHITMLVNSGHKVDVACRQVRNVDQDLKELTCRYFQISFSRVPLAIDNFKAYLQLDKLIGTERYDIIHTHTPVASFVTRLAARKHPMTKVIYTAHGFHFFNGSSKLSWLIYSNMEKLAARWTDTIVTINSEDYLFAQSLKKLGVRSVFKVHGVGVNVGNFNAVSKEQKNILRFKNSLGTDDFIILCIGELNVNKHQDLIIEATNILKKQINNVKVLFVGDGNMADTYKSLVKKLQLDEYIKFLGFRSDIPELCALSDLLVSSSRREGLPVNIMEAMASGLPVVATNCRGSRDLIVDGKNGLLTEISNVSDMAEQIYKLYENVDLRIEFSAKGTEIVKRYSVEAVLNELNIVYAGLIKRKSE